MKKLLVAFCLTSLFISTPVLAQDEQNIPQEENKAENSSETKNDDKKSTPLFQDTNDRTQKLNQTNDTLLNSSASTPFSQQAFVPDIALVLDSTYVYRSFAHNVYKGFNTPGWGNVGEFQTNGFNLNYAELSLASTVDPYFDLLAVIPFSLEGASIEEAFINTRSLPYNFQVKAGKFRSSFGRLNSQHEHAWDFAGPPMVYTSMFGGEQLNEKGIQVNWLAPIDTYLLVGAELSQGENEVSFGTKGFTIGKNKIEEINYPNLFQAFAKTSYDIDQLTILGGISYVQGNNRLNEGSDNKITGFSGFSRIYAGDLTFKYFIDSYRYLSLQSEYIYRSTNGNAYTTQNITSTEKNQSGLYSQLVWRFDQLWRAGIRFDLLNKNDILENDVPSGNKLVDNPANLTKYTAMLECNPTEFSRLRLQFSHDRSKYDTNLQPVNEALLQMNIAIGAHGAHAF